MSLKYSKEKKPNKKTHTNNKFWFEYVKICYYFYFVGTFIHDI